MHVVIVLTVVSIRLSRSIIIHYYTVYWFLALDDLEENGSGLCCSQTQIWIINRIHSQIRTWFWVQVTWPLPYLTIPGCLSMQSIDPPWPFRTLKPYKLQDPHHSWVFGFSFSSSLEADSTFTRLNIFYIKCRVLGITWPSFWSAQWQQWVGWIGLEHTG